MKPIIIFILYFVFFLCFTLQAWSKADKVDSTESLHSKIINDSVTDAWANVNCKDTFKVGDIVHIKFSSTAIFDKASASNKDIILYINDMPLPDIKLRGKKNLDKTAFFKLESNSKSLEVWKIIVKDSRDGICQINFSVGFTDGTMLRSAVKHNLYIQLFAQDTRSLLWFGIGLWLLLFVVLAITTNMLRGYGAVPVGQLRKFSLSQTQFAWWSFIFIGCYLYLYILTKQLPDITNTCLILIGISIATTAGGQVVGGIQNKNNQPSDDNISKNFILDLLTDDSGTSIHRLQNFVFTIIFGFIFIRSVGCNLEFPEWDSNVLILMGISSGAYLGLKATEKSSSGQQVATKIVAGKADSEVKKDTLVGPTA